MWSPIWKEILFEKLIDSSSSSTHLDVRNLIDDAAFLDSLDKCVASSVVGDCQSQGVLRLDDLDLLRPALSVREDEIIESDLTAEQLRHVNFVWV